MFIKKMMVVSLFVSAMSFISLAQAASLTITNNTSSDSTAIINGGRLCSSYMPNGITHAHSVNTIPETTIKFACMTNSTDCVADVYMSSNCSGNRVATVDFNVSTGIILNPDGTPKITTYNNTYTLGGTGFNLSISGP